MKVCLLLSGHFRSYERTFTTLKNNILDQYNPDIFIFSWENLGHNIAGSGDNHLLKLPINLTRINQLYCPKKIIIEKMKKWETNKYLSRLGPGSHGPEQIFGMYYGINKCNQLKLEYEKQNNFTYDIAIRCRPDIFFENKLDINELKECKDNEIYFPRHGNYSGLNDQFSFSNSKSMDKYSEIYNYLEQHFDNGCIWHPESMLKFHIDYCNLDIKRTNINYQILRASGGFFKNAQEIHLGDVK